MRTTLDIDDILLAKAKRSALPVYAGKGGLRPEVADTRSHRALLDAADEARWRPT